MDKKELENLFCAPDISIKEAMAFLNKAKGQMLIVVDEDKRLLGVLTDGDIRRALLKDIPLTIQVSQVMNTKPQKLSLPNRRDAAKNMKTYSIKQIPIVDNYERVQDVVLWEDVLVGDFQIQKAENYVFIMAGGKGSRLDPFTKILPKPLIPIGDKPIIEIVMDKCKSHGFCNFIISLNYKAAIIKHYFAENKYDASVQFIQEEKPLGTAGSLSLAKNHIKNTFIVTNCDVIVDIDYFDALRFHKERNHHVTIVGAIKNFKIPYGVVKMDNGYLISIIEKPEYDFVINAGVYVIEPEILNLLPENIYLDMPNLILMAKEKGYVVGVYPFSGEWIDVGQWEEYRKAIARFGF